VIVGGNRGLSWCCPILDGESQTGARTRGRTRPILYPMPCQFWHSRCRYWWGLQADRHAQTTPRMFRAPGSTSITVGGRTTRPPTFPPTIVTTTNIVTKRTTLSGRACSICTGKWQCTRHILSLQNGRRHAVGGSTRRWTQHTELETLWRSLSLVKGRKTKFKKKKEKKKLHLGKIGAAIPTTNK